MVRRGRTQVQQGRLKRAFLENYAVYGNITRAAEQVGVPRQRVYQWQEHDDQFASAFREAEVQATEVLESEARRRAVDGIEKHRRVYDSRGNLIDEYTEQLYSDTLLIFLLKARNPAKYRERVEQTIEANSRMVVEVVYSNADPNLSQAPALGAGSNQT